MENIFEEKNAQILRKWLIDNIKFTDDDFPYKKSFYAVINPTNFCPVGCPHCLYSSLKLKKPSEQISKKLMDKFIEIANQAGIEMLVFSGGGEPFENLPVIIDGIKKIENLKDAVIITSGYFAKDENAVMRILDKIFNAANSDRKKIGFNPVKITLRISRDNSQCKTVPLRNIVHILKYVIGKNNHSKIRAVVRTILDYGENNDTELAERLGLNLLPKKDEKDIYKDLPTIDGLPTRWLTDKNLNIEIPVIYKPIYFLGRALNTHSKNIHSLWSIVESEEKSGTPLNLCVRGPKGEGHNYYETIFGGYKEWKKLSLPSFDESKRKIKKELALYLPASGRLLINNGTPDIAPSLKKISNWNQFLKIVYSDPVERLLIEKGPFFIKDMAKEVEKDIDEKINKTNFVFSVSLLGLIDPSLRLYITVRAIQYYLGLNKIKIKNSLAKKILGLDCIKSYKEHKNSLSEMNKKRYMDPITADAENIILEDKTDNAACTKLLNLVLS